MKTKVIVLIGMALLSMGNIFAQTEATNHKFQFGAAEHFLDGYSLNFQYQGALLSIWNLRMEKENMNGLLGPEKEKEIQISPTVPEK